MYQDLCVEDNRQEDFSPNVITKECGTCLNEFSFFETETDMDTKCKKSGCFVCSGCLIRYNGYSEIEYLNLPDHHPDLLEED